MLENRVSCVRLVVSFCENMKEMIPMKQASGNLSRNPSTINGEEQRQEDFQKRKSCRRLVFSVQGWRKAHDL